MKLAKQPRAEKAETVGGLAERVDRRLGRIEKGLRSLEQELRGADLAPNDPLRTTAIEVASLAGEGRSVVAGPWLGEVGFELLYWIPFLTWAAERHPDLGDRLHVISRGGARSWYAHFTRHYRDVYDYVSPDQLIDGRGRRTKQVEVTPFEDELLRRVRTDVGLDAGTLHPAVMYEPLLRLTRAGTSAQFRRIARYKTFDPPPLGPLVGALPDDFVAVRFYFNNSFPNTEENRRFAETAVAALAAETHVVLLDTGLRLDDHADLGAMASDRIVSLERFMTPGNNLDIQSIAVSRARSFLGTYGGLSYLAPFYGVPSLSLYSDGTQFLFHHLELAQAVFRECGLGDHVALHTSQVDLVRGLLR